MVRAKRLFATLFASALLVVGVAAPSASAQVPEDTTIILTGGLINVTVGDVTILDNANIAVAAAICDVNVNVLSLQLQEEGEVVCEPSASTGG